MFTLGHKTYETCQSCGNLVRINKPLIGRLHVCVPPRRLAPCTDRQCVECLQWWDGPWYWVTNPEVLAQGDPTADNAFLGLGGEPELVCQPCYWALVRELTITRAEW